MNKLNLKGLMLALGLSLGLGLGLTAQPAVQAADYHQELKTPGKLTIGLEGTYAPFSYKNKAGKLVGYDVDVAKAVAKELHLKPVFVETKFDSLVSGLDAGKYDVIYNDMAAKPARRKHYNFGRRYLYSHAVIISKKGSGITKMADLKGKKAAQSTTSNYGKAAKRAGADLVAVPGFAEALTLVTNGQADVTLNEDDAWGVYKKQHSKTPLRAVRTDQLKQYGAAPVLNKKNTALTRRISKAEKALAKDGTLKAISKHYFGQDLSQPGQKHHHHQHK